MSAMHQSFEETCTTCGNSELCPERVRSALWHEGRLVVVEGIPALACGACGERFYEPQASAALDALRAAGFPVSSARCEVRVPVFTLGETP
jgi:YgiT-type zinc finger domain-containing protein